MMVCTFPAMFYYLLERTSSPYCITLIQYYSAPLSFLLLPYSFSHIHRFPSLLTILIRMCTHARKLTKSPH